VAGFALPAAMPDRFSKAIRPLSRLEIGDQLEFHGLLDWQVAISCWAKMFRRGRFEPMIQPRGEMCLVASVTWNRGKGRANVIEYATGHG